MFLYKLAITMNRKHGSCHVAFTLMSELIWIDDHLKAVVIRRLVIVLSYCQLFTKTDISMRLIKNDIVVGVKTGSQQSNMK